MYRMDVVRTIGNEKLTLEAPWLLKHLHIFFQAFLNGLPFVFISLIITEVLQPYMGKQFSLSFLLILSLAVSYFLVRKQYSPTVISGTNHEQFLQAVIPILKEYGFKINQNNGKLLFASCTTNRIHISDNFYATYTQNSILVFCICELPFPFSVIKARAVLASIKSRWKSG
ncbi:hypothetical protein [Alteromonas sp. KUL49]|uniref:hypothetical protein n=1 Tax=Alteromonas sp. KUL49 TaxID=2480798 RepID=UPI00102F10F0|nr:hypothetical protein [Alteromonas sp. KUL49]TAP42620.1 hypothetical protein EYS00_03140 [Alteromonas sp. KUL49]GEA10259.1 hypothetical protein KUL49_06340 [Alteromonas sp. KUL49]